MTSPINGAGSPERISQLQYVQSETKNDVQEVKRNVLDVSELVKEGMLPLMKGLQSLRTDTTHATSAAKRPHGGGIETDSPAKAIKLSVAGEGDANKAERLAASVPGVLTSQTNITQPNNKAVDFGKSDSRSTVSNVSSSLDQARSQPAVEGGTDITAVEAAGSGFSNVIGPQNQIALANIIATTSQEQEKQANLQAAKMLKMGAESLQRSGDLNVDAAKQRATGALVKGLTGMAVQTGATVIQTKALSKESKSIDTNVAGANKTEHNIRKSQDAIMTSKDNMVNQNKQVSREVEGTMSHSHAADMHEAGQMREKHNKIQLDTQKTRVTAEYANQTGHSAQGVIEGMYGVEAAKDQKEADLARADHDLKKELADIHSQRGKKDAETDRAIRETTNTILNTNSNTVASIAERTR